MPRLSLLISAFVVSFLVFVVWMAPAELLASRLGAIPLGPGRLQLTEPAGRLWDGRANWRWQRFRGELHWALDWRGLVPGVRLDLREADNRLQLKGWLSPAASGLTVRDLDLKVPVALVAEAIPHGGADGEVTGRVEELVWTGTAFEALAGSLRYSGGQVRWGSDGSARIPALDGRLFMEKGRARGVVTGPEEQRLAEASLGGGKVRFRVFRAWPALLGQSRGGAPDDVVFEVTRPVQGSGGEQQ